MHRLAVVVLEFPKFRDGRAFSWARMLRTRLRFKGEIRATGDFLYDQLAFMRAPASTPWRCARISRSPNSTARWREITHVYQPGADGKKTIRELRAGESPFAKVRGILKDFASTDEIMDMLRGE